MANITRIKAKDDEPRSSDSDKSAATHKVKIKSSENAHTSDAPKTIHKIKSTSTTNTASTTKSENKSESPTKSKAKSTKTKPTPITADPKLARQAEKEAKKAEKQEAKEQKRAKKAEKRKNRKPLPKPLRIIFKPFTALGSYIKHSWQELRQVRWPNRKTTWKMSFAVIIYSGIFIVFIMLLDALFTVLFNNLLG